jgi:UDP-N-acetylmuramate dehydrogenase
VSDFSARLRDAFSDRVLADAPLAALTTFKVGGPADWLVTLRGAEELRVAMDLAREHHVPVKVLGGGSNVLVADAGVRGLVVRVHGGDVRALGPLLVRADAGVTINGLVRWTIPRGIAALEPWAGTPGTVGGAVYGNAHFRNRLISELIETVTIVTPHGQLSDVTASDMEFGYDYCRLHRTHEVVV